MLLIRISAVYGTEAYSPSWLRGFSAKHPVCLFLHIIWSIKKFSFPPKSLCRGIAQSAVHRNDNNHSGRKSSPGKLSMAKCRTATASVKGSLSCSATCGENQAVLSVLRYSSSRRTGCSAERSLRQDAE